MTRHRVSRGRHATPCGVLFVVPGAVFEVQVHVRCQRPAHWFGLHRARHDGRWLTWR